MYTFFESDAQRGFDFKGVIEAEDAGESTVDIVWILTAKCPTSKPNPYVTLVTSLPDY